MADGALTPPDDDVIVIGAAGGSAGDGAPTSVSVSTPATFVNGPAPSGFGSNSTPWSVRYGLSVRMAFGSDVVPWMMSRCFWTRYSTEVTETASGSGFTVMTAVAAAEATPPAFVATTEMVRTAFGEPVASVGAVNDTVAVFADTGVTFRLTSAGVPAVCVAVKVMAWAGTFGSVALTVKEPAAVVNTVSGAIWATVGAAAAFTVMLAVAEAVPHAPVAVTVAVTGEVAPKAENVALEPVGGTGATLPLETFHAKVIGPVPVEVAARVTVPPAATVYGPPALTVTAVHAGAGMVLPGHGLSCPGITPVLEG